MIALLIGACLLTMSTAPAPSATPSAAPPVAVREPALRAEILKMEAEDQAARDAVLATQKPGQSLSSLDFSSADAVDAANTKRVRQIFDRHGWPGRSLVGEDGAHAFWLLVQHVTDQPFMERCLAALEGAVRRGEASGRDYAYLLDRVLVRQGKPQRFGTQTKLVDDGKRMVFSPIEDAGRLDARRLEVGLPTMGEYVRMLESLYKIPVEPLPAPAP